LNLDWQRYGPQIPLPIVSEWSANRKLTHYLLVTPRG
jgi:hypothetical protein